MADACDAYVSQDEHDILPCARCGCFREDHPSESEAQRREAEREVYDA